MSKLIQHSPNLFDSLSFLIPINGNPLTLALFETAKQSILHLGELEHTSDWDPYLYILFKDGTHIETQNGYPEIIFGDFNTEEQTQFFKHYQEITSIGIHLSDPNDDQKTIIDYIQLSEIDSISLYR